ncbi:MAG TPA: hypothetical protein VHK01_15280, partial [Lacipirellulaceae bacterium]|nr:hypothetical protein [Lacipirellulaceae bacterium]
MSHVGYARIGFVLIVATLFEFDHGGVLRAAVGTLADSSGEVVAWGDNQYGPTNVPAGSYKA